MVRASRLLLIGRVVSLNLTLGPLSKVLPDKKKAAKSRSRDVGALGLSGGLECVVEAAVQQAGMRRWVSSPALRVVWHVAGQRTRTGHTCLCQSHPCQFLRALSLIRTDTHGVTTKVTDHGAVKRPH